MASLELELVVRLDIVEDCESKETFPVGGVANEGRRFDDGGVAV